MRMVEGDRSLRKGGQSQKDRTSIRKSKIIKHRMHPMIKIQLYFLLLCLNHFAGQNLGVTFFMIHYLKGIYA